jgi:hypothetical protein
MKMSIVSTRRLFNVEVSLKRASLCHDDSGTLSIKKWEFA